MSDMALQNAAAYAAQHRLRLAERLGFGIHGTVLVAEHEGKQDRSALNKGAQLWQYFIAENVTFIKGCRPPVSAR